MAALRAICARCGEGRPEASRDTEREAAAEAERIAMNDTRKYDEDWRGVDPEVARQILRQGELFLEAQLKIAIAADQRAMVTASILTGFSAALFVASVTFLARIDRINIGYACFIMATMLFLGAACCVYAARPISFWHAGTWPKEWWGFRHQSDFTVIIGGEAELYQERIEFKSNGPFAKREMVAMRNIYRISRPLAGGSSVGDTYFL